MASSLDLLYQIQSGKGKYARGKDWGKNSVRSSESCRKFVENCTIF